MTYKNLIALISLLYLVSLANAGLDPYNETIQTVNMEDCLRVIQPNVTSEWSCFVTIMKSEEESALVSNQPLYLIPGMNETFCYEIKLNNGFQYSSLYDVETWCNDSNNVQQNFKSFNFKTNEKQGDTEVTTENTWSDMIKNFWKFLPQPLEDKTNELLNNPHALEQVKGTGTSYLSLLWDLLRYSILFMSIFVGILVFLVTNFYVIIVTLLFIAELAIIVYSFEKNPNGLNGFSAMINYNITLFTILIGLGKMLFDMILVLIDFILKFIQWFFDLITWIIGKIPGLNILVK